MNYRAVLAHFPKITYARYKKISAQEDLQYLWRAELDQLVASGFEPTIADEFIRWREACPPERILERLDKERMTTVSIGEPDYPRLLAEINDPPLTLFVRGNTQTLSHTPAIGVVGTRHPSPYGLQATETIVQALVQQNVAIVSGLAIGIDGAAHRAALGMKGRTIAVLGSGVDAAHIFPTLHQRLAQDIIDHDGAVISEYPPGSIPTPYSFPMRNRIIAGLTLGTLVTEAPRESGALITARAALDYNREVFAIPHPITTTNGEGNNRLLQRGAALVITAENIIEALNLKISVPPPRSPVLLNLTPYETLLLAALSDEPIPIDALIKVTGVPSSQVGSALALLELKQLIRNIGGMRYIKK